MEHFWFSMFVVWIPLFCFSILPNGKRGEKDERGQGLVEYALIIGIIAIAMVTTLTVLSGNLDTTFNAIGTALNPVGGP